MPGPCPQDASRLNETQVAELTHLSASYTAPCAQVQRARILLLAHQHPDWTNGRIAHEVGCCLETVKVWRQRWQAAERLADQPRTGAPRAFPAVIRAPRVAWACTKPKDHGKVWKRWSGEKLAQMASEEGSVPAMSSRTIRRWLREDQLRPWRYHSWQHGTDPPFVDQAGPVVNLYEQAPMLVQQGEAVCCIDAKTSIQARQRVSATPGAIPPYPMHVADRYRRMGALNRCCALMVATGATRAQCFHKRCFADFKAFWLALLANAVCQGLKVLHVILDHGSTHAPKPWANGLASLHLSCEGRISWLPKSASWLDQVELIFSKVQREVLTPNDFSNTTGWTQDLMDYFTEINEHPKPIKWTYTQVKWLAKFGTPSPNQLAA